MNNISLYFKAKYINSATAAVELAKNKPSEKNIKFAEKILSVKMAAADILLERSSGCKGFHQIKAEKYSSLLKCIESLKSNQFHDTSISSIVKSLPEKPEKLQPPEIKDFSDKMLYKYDLSGKDLRDCNFHNANKSGCIIERFNKEADDFSGSYIDGVDLSNTLFTSVSFSNASLIGTKVIANSADYSGSKLDNATISFDLPDRWCDYDIDVLLNDLNNDSTLFHTISTISDNYSDLKTTLMEKIVRSIEDSNLDINPASFPRASLLKNINSKNYYMKSDIIKNFTTKVVSSELQNANDKITLKKLSPEALSLCVKTIAQTTNDAEFHKHTIGNNGSFIQLMVLSNHNDNLELQNQARSLYSTYLSMDEVKPFVEKEEFGNGEKEPDWSDKSSLNYILINNNKAMIIDQNNISKMLHLEKTATNVQWDHFYLYDNNECQAAGDINQKELFGNDFKIFEDSYTYDLNHSSIFNLLSTLNLSDYHDRFKSVLSGETVPAELKLVRTDDQLKLNDIFAKILTRPNDSAKETMLITEHYEKLISAFDLDSKNNTVKSQTLLSLAAMFSRYSSSSVFGTESESPQVLRDYAYALMSKANELNPEVTGGNFNDWKNRLLGLNDAFTCTAILASIMTEHAKASFNEVISKIIPPVWA
ncbi:hypothetical protein GKQ23_09225 [Erwinia sp. E602]|uniref:pentapeptide repeat-containing protein n=1 Tax=Erwinia sp. E602 TaxID=2675378 RepID=UPI001BAA9B2D|nr:pentapeptide repeat-containing protein [Erwinia sp. E602]QUG75160.1 hypothetical protein GKQ23_09225 [Erwinia sp. E602]